MMTLTYRHDGEEASATMTTERTIKKSVEMFNSSLGEFYKKTLPEMLNARNGKIKLGQWFEAQRIKEESGIYEERIAFLQSARRDGYDVKINMQSYELSYHGIIED